MIDWLMATHTAENWVWVSLCAITAIGVLGSAWALVEGRGRLERAIAYYDMAIAIMADAPPPQTEREEK